MYPCWYWSKCNSYPPTPSRMYPSTFQEVANLSQILLLCPIWSHSFCDIPRQSFCMSRSVLCPHTKPVSMIDMNFLWLYVSWRDKLKNVPKTYAWKWTRSLLVWSNIIFVKQLEPLVLLRLVSPSSSFVPKHNVIINLRQRIPIFNPSLPPALQKNKNPCNE